jgi:hypothetical protein
MRYRDFISHLKSVAAEDEGARIVNFRRVAETRDTWLSLIAGRDGGIAIVNTARGAAPRDAGLTFKLDPTTTCAALATALSVPGMMSLAWSLLTPGKSDPDMTLDFADGLTDLAKNPFPTEPSVAPATKPPSLDASLWRRIPHAQRHEYIKKMAHALVRGVHPDDTVADLLAAA